MFDMHTKLERAINAFPDVPSAVLPANMCDKPFMGPIEPTHYVLKTPPGEFSDVRSHSISLQYN